MPTTDDYFTAGPVERAAYRAAYMTGPRHRAERTTPEHKPTHRKDTH